ncbi:hypothetical protein BV22DRAFT_1046589 [Leucogyrophana mollusca]|uniref:Uncharacterized protein n=1 Tax=Leucogyrophana mollusca TaxID=85980 RepID=A0ACB8BK77_9AGAM|nr:hypothetical protein BV22DRAFT_1046589 [Leucogyrophana mollusca]
MPGEGIVYAVKHSHPAAWRPSPSAQPVPRTPLRHALTEWRRSQQLREHPLPYLAKIRLPRRARAPDAARLGLVELVASRRWSGVRGQDTPGGIRRRGLVCWVGEGGAGRRQARKARRAREGEGRRGGRGQARRARAGEERRGRRGEDKAQ